MLQAIRDKSSGWIGYAIIILISVPFALWGVNSYLGGGAAPPAATVNGEEIGVRDLDRAFANYRQRLSQMFGGNIPESIGSESVLKEQVLSQMIEETSLSQYAKDNRYRIGDKELSAIISGIEVFQRDGSFDKATYEAQLRSQGFTPAGFELELRRTQAMEQLQAGIAATSFVVPTTEKQFANLSNQSRKIRSLTRKVSREGIDVSATEIEQHYQQQSVRYSIPEKVKIDYIELSLSGIMDGVSIDEAVLVDKYNQAKDSYTEAESRRTRHVLIRLANDASEEDKSTALEKINSIHQRASNGEDFAALAKELSEDPGSAPDGGSLGEVERGMMVEAFENALFDLQENEISAPVKTSFGWHVIKLEKVSGGDIASFDSVRSEIENEAKLEIAESRIFELLDNLSNLSYEEPDSLLPAAEQLDLKLQTSDWFDRFSGEGIAAEAKIRQTAFSTDVFNKKLNSSAIELDQSRVVFLRINDIKESELKPLSEVSEEIRAELIRAKATKLNEEEGRKSLAMLEGTLTLDELSDNWSQPVIDYGFVDRKNSEINSRMLQTVFSMPKPDQDSPVYEGLVESSGDFSVIELSGVISNNSETDQAAKKSLLTGVSNAEYQSVLKYLASRAEVVKIAAEDL